MTTQAERWESWQAPKDLADCVRMFFEILNHTEESDSGRQFQPNYISSCRVWDTHRLNRLITQMKELTKPSEDNTRTDT